MFFDIDSRIKLNSIQILQCVLQGIRKLHYINPENVHIA